MTSRAITPSEKAIITGRLLAAWLKVPGLRLGQLIVNAVNNSSGADFPESPIGLVLLSEAAC